MQPSFIENIIVERSMVCYQKNPFCQYLIDLFGKEEAMRLIYLYHIGTSNKWDGSTVFWQIDAQQNVRTGKVVPFNPNSQDTNKNAREQIGWAHVEMHISGYNYLPCLFGEHLLSAFPTHRIMVVESEATAVIASHFLPDYLWLATGEDERIFSFDCMQVLKGRSITFFPRLGSTEDWQKKVQDLCSIAHSISVSNVLEQMADDQQRARKLDIADFLLMTDTPQMILAQMVRKNPALQLLIDRLDLVPVEGP